MILTTSLNLGQEFYPILLSNLRLQEAIMSESGYNEISNGLSSYDISLGNRDIA